MTGYELTLGEFAALVETASRHHRKQIAGWLSLTAHARRGEVCFRGPDGVELPLQEVHRRCQVDDQIRRWAYNLYMNYAHFG